MPTENGVKRGPRGSARGVPEAEVSNILNRVVGKLAKGGLEYQRAEAQELFEKEGLEGSQLDGLLFSLQRSIPGIENISYGTYRLPEEWKRATKHRLWRFRAPRINVLEAEELAAILENYEEDELTEGVLRMKKKLNAELGMLD